MIFSTSEILSSRETEVEEGGPQDIIAGLDEMLIGDKTLKKEDREKVILKANMASEFFSSKLKESVNVFISPKIVELIQKRLPDENERGDLLRKYKDMLEMQIGLTTVTDESIKNRLIQDGEEAAEKLFLVKNPKFTFSEGET